MMEVQEPPTRKIDTSKLFCRKGNKAKLFCGEKDCLNGGILCSHQDCECTTMYHGTCGYTVPLTIIQKIQAKRVSLPHDVEIALQKLDTVYCQAIERLSNDRDQLLIWKQKFGLNVEQAKLIEALQSENFDDIQGRLMNKIKREVNERQNFEGLNQDWVSRIWKRKKDEFTKIFDKLAIFRYKQIKSFKFVDFEFDEKNKPTIAAITNSGKTLAMNGNGGGQRIAFLTPSFEDLINSKGGQSVWAIKVDRQASWVGLGLCNYNQIKNLGFQFINYSQLGHGNYIISFNSYSWSSSQADQNNRTPVFNFNTGDTINICYDSENKKLKFWKNKTQRHVLNNIEQPKNDYLVPCINVNGNGDTVSIVQPNLQIDWNQF